MSGIIAFLFLSFSPVFALDSGDTAPTFFLRDASGGEFFLSNFVGKSAAAPSRGVIINFFASYCVPCRTELPMLDSLVPEFEKSGVKVIVIGLREDYDKINPMLAGLNVRRPLVLSDRHGLIGDKYGVNGLPATFLVGGDGRIRCAVKGAPAGMEELLREKVKGL